MIVGIDSMILVYAGVVPQKRATKKRTEKEKNELADLKRRAKYLFQDLKEAEAIVVLPTIALSELLVPVGSEERSSPRSRSDFNASRLTIMQPRSRRIFGRDSGSCQPISNMTAVKCSRRTQ